jgi:prolyl-tRNA synthetase
MSNHWKARGSVGSIGGKYSDEYHLISDLGEDEIFICNSCKSSFNAELVNTDEIPKCSSCSSNDLLKANAIEVGHAFLLGNKYSEKFKATFLTNDSQNKLVFILTNI